ncbi:hypothetical protein PAMA_000157 [Pampus argenteus]
MFNLNWVVARSVSNVCRQFSASLHSSGRSLCESRAVRLQEAAKDTKVSSPDFSCYPPLPGQDSPLRWDGKKFEELPIIHIKATYNNTHIQLTDSAGLSMARTSCGMEGFKNSKKSTPIAAQIAGSSAAAKATLKGVKFVRIVIKGLGPGRLSAIKGLTMGGLQVVSITDDTPVPHNGCRPRKARRI